MFHPVEELIDQLPIMHCQLGAPRTKTLARNLFRLCELGDDGAVEYMYTDAGSSSSWRYDELATDWTEWAIS